MKTAIFIALIIIVIIFILLGIRYFMCLNEQGQKCFDSSSRVAAGSIPISGPIPVGLIKKITCSFFTGRNCI